MSIYVKKFLLPSNTIDALQSLKDMLGKKYKIKDLGKAKIIIKQKITRNTTTYTMKIDQSIFITVLVIKKRLTEYIANVILIKVGSAIKIFHPQDYDKRNLFKYQYQIDKLIILICGIKPNIIFVIKHLIKYNINPRFGYFQATRRVVRYLKETMQVGLFMSKKIVQQETYYPLVEKVIQTVILPAILEITSQ